MMMLDMLIFMMFLPVATGLYWLVCGRESSTLRLCNATASQVGSMRGNRRKTAKFVLRVAEGRAGEPDEGRHALLYTPWKTTRLKD